MPLHVGTALLPSSPLNFPVETAKNKYNNAHSHRDTYARMRDGPGTERADFPRQRRRSTSNETVEERSTKLIRDRSPELQGRSWDCAHWDLPEATEAGSGNTAAGGRQ